MSTIGAKLKKLREEKGYSLEEAGKAIGLNRQLIYKYETGIVSNIPSDRIEKLATLYGVSPAYIMGWTNRNGVQSDGYYTDPETARLAEQFRTNSDLRVLFDVSADLSPESLKEAYNYIRYLRDKERGDED